MEGEREREREEEKKYGRQTQIINKLEDSKDFPFKHVLYKN